MPIYIRYYPEKSVAGHIGGYVGSRGKLPTGPINHMDPLFEQVEGRAGLEKEFNKALTGTPGVWRLMFDEDGNKILDELQIRPKPGGAVVTTLNLKWQRDAERILSRGKRRGAHGGAGLRDGGNTGDGLHAFLRPEPVYPEHFPKGLRCPAQ